MTGLLVRRLLASLLLLFLVLSALFFLVHLAPGKPVSLFDDPRVPGVACHISQARTGGISGSLGLAEDPSRFSIACRQVGPVTLPDKLPREENVFSESTSIFFKNTKVIRLFDAKRNTLVYVAVSRKVIEGSPMNAISTVPVQRWDAR